MRSDEYNDFTIKCFLLFVSVLSRFETVKYDMYQVPYLGIFCYYGYKLQKI